MESTLTDDCIVLLCLRKKFEFPKLKKGTVSVNYVICGNGCGVCIESNKIRHGEWKKFDRCPNCKVKSDWIYNYYCYPRAFERNGISRHSSAEDVSMFLEGFIDEELQFYLSNLPIWENEATLFELLVNTILNVLQLYKEHPEYDVVQMAGGCNKGGSKPLGTYSSMFKAWLVNSVMRIFVGPDGIRGNYHRLKDLEKYRQDRISYSKLVVPVCRLVCGLFCDDIDQRLLVDEMLYFNSHTWKKSTLLTAMKRGVWSEEFIRRRRLVGCEKLCCTGINIREAVMLAATVSKECFLIFDEVRKMVGVPGKSCGQWNVLSEEFNEKDCLILKERNAVSLERGYCYAFGRPLQLKEVWEKKNLLCLSVEKKNKRDITTNLSNEDSKSPKSACEHQKDSTRCSSLNSRKRKCGKNHNSKRRNI